jgi:ankyrin repeat protein
VTKPLGEAVLFGSVEMVKYLISKGAYIDSRSITESTPANYAASNGNKY